jgi:hypothetical protein
MDVTRANCPDTTPDLSWSNTTQGYQLDLPGRSLKVETRVRTPLGLRKQICQTVDCQHGGLVVSTLTFESIEDWQDLEVLWPARSFLGADDVAEVGDHYLDVVDSHSVSFQR